MRVVVRQQEFGVGISIPPPRQTYELAAADLRVHMKERGLEAQFHHLDRALQSFETAFNFATPPTYRECQTDDLHNGVRNIVNGQENLNNIFISAGVIDPIIRVDADHLGYQAERLFTETFFKNCPCGGKR